MKRMTSCIVSGVIIFLQTSKMLGGPANFEVYQSTGLVKAWGKFIPCTVAKRPSSMPYGNYKTGDGYSFRSYLRDYYLHFYCHCLYTI